MLKVLFLGTGGSMPTVARSLPAILINEMGRVSSSTVVKAPSAK